MSAVRRLTVSIFSLVVTGLLAAPASAQEVLSVDFRGGASVPAGDLADLMNTSGGFAVATSAPLNDRLGVRFLGGAEFYGGADIDSGVGAGGRVANLSLVHGQVGLNYRLAGVGDERLTVDVNGMAGATVANSEFMEYSTADGGVIRLDLSSAWPSFSGGVDVGYGVGPQVDLYLSAQGIVIFSDSDETADFTRLGVIGNVEGMDTITSIPLSLGVRFYFPG